jgi:thiamine kinase-like enzyme
MKREEMKEDKFMGRTAEELAKLHAFVPPAELNPWHVDPGPGMWTQLWAWFKQAKETTLDECKLSAADTERFNAWKDEIMGPDFAKAEAELKMLEEVTTAVGSPVVFCHNDALAENILVVNEEEILLIDFEYGGCNYRGFDIANHWNEWAGGTQAEMNGVPVYADFPTPEKQLVFCERYLAAAGGGGDAAALNEEANKFVLANHWYWGLWGLNQAVTEGCDTFDYLLYWQNRLKEYYTAKGK